MQIPRYWHCSIIIQRTVTYFFTNGLSPESPGLRTITEVIVEELLEVNLTDVFTMVKSVP